MTKVTFAELWHDTVATAHTRWFGFLLVAIVASFLPSLIMRIAFPEMPSRTRGDIVPASFYVALVTSIATYLLGTLAIADGAIRIHGSPLVFVSGQRLRVLGKSIRAGLLVVICMMIAGFAALLVGGLFVVAFEVIASGKLPARGAGGTNWLVLLTCVPIFGWLNARLSPLTGVLLSESVGVADAIGRAFDLSRNAALVLLAPTLIFSAGSWGLFGAARRLALGDSTSIASEIGIMALGAVSFVYSSVFAGVVYRQLRAAEAGGQSSGTRGAVPAE